MLIRFVQSAGGHEEGEEVDLSDFVAEQWISAGLAVLAPTAKALDTPPQDKMIRRGSVTRKAVGHGR